VTGEVTYNMKMNKEHKDINSHAFLKIKIKICLNSYASVPKIPPSLTTHSTSVKTRKELTFRYTSTIWIIIFMLQISSYLSFLFIEDLSMQVSIIIPHSSNVPL